MHTPVCCEADIAAALGKVKKASLRISMGLFAATVVPCSQDFSPFLLDFWLANSPC
jgi:hypothetical protein